MAEKSSIKQSLMLHWKDYLKDGLLWLFLLFASLGNAGVYYQATKDAIPVIAGLTIPWFISIPLILLSLSLPIFAWLRSEKAPKSTISKIIKGAGLLLGVGIFALLWGTLHLDLVTTVLSGLIFGISFITLDTTSFENTFNKWWSKLGTPEPSISKPRDWKKTLTEATLWGIITLGFLFACLTAFSGCQSFFSLPALGLPKILALVLSGISGIAQAACFVTLEGTAMYRVIKKLIFPKKGDKPEKVNKWVNRFLENGYTVKKNDDLVKNTYERTGKLIPAHKLEARKEMLARNFFFVEKAEPTTSNCSETHLAQPH